MRNVLSAAAVLFAAAAAQAAPAPDHAAAIRRAATPTPAQQQDALRERMGQRQLDLLIASILDDGRPQAQAKRAEATRSASR